MVSISHTYYSEGCKDFDFVIPADTAQLLKNGKLLAKVREGKLYVLFEGDETHAALIPLSGKTLRIGLKLLNPFFSNFTTLDFNSTIPLYDNTNNPNDLKMVKLVALVGQIFSHSLIDTTRPITITLKNANDQILQTDTITVINNRTTVSYHLLGQAAGTYTVTESSLENTKATAYYLDTQLQSQGIFGVIEIKIDDIFYIKIDDIFYNYTPEFKFIPEFKITFNAKQETLKYYVVVKTSDNINQFSIADSGSGTIKFKEPVSLAPDNKYALLLGNSDTKVVLLESEEKIARQANARKKIQLNKNGSVLMENLPQPTASKANADIIIQLSKP
jgi:hypothetical protein